MVKRLFVGGLAYETTEDELRALFSTCGRVDGVRLIMDGDRGRSKGFGFVDMSTEAEAHAAIGKLNGSSLGGRQLAVCAARPQEPRPQESRPQKPGPQAERGGAPAGKPGFVERRSGKDRRRQPSGSPHPRPGGQPGHDGGKRGGYKGPRRESGGGKKPWRGKPGGSGRGGGRRPGRRY